MIIFSLVAMTGLEKCCITSAFQQWHSGERPVARGPLVSDVLASVMILGRNSLLKFVYILNYNNISKLQYPMDPESSMYIMSALAHQKYTLSDGSFREIKHNTVPCDLFFNKRSGAVVLSPDWRARRCRRSRRGFEPHSPVVFHISPYNFFLKYLHH